MILSKTMERERILYMKDGALSSFIPNNVASDEEIDYIVENGERDAMMAMGMGYPIDVGHSPNLDTSSTISRIIHDERYRGPLISYIGRYVTSNERTIYRSIPTGALDREVAMNLAKLPKRRGGDRVSGRVHQVANILSRVAHVKVEEYLDFGTGRGDVAEGIGRMMDARVTGTEVYDDPDRVVDTLVLRQGQSMPESWEGRFQMVTAFSVLHHVHDQVGAISELCRVLAPGGLLIVREHDYVDDPVMWKDGIPIILEPKDRPFRTFLDAIHVAAMAVSSTSGIEPEFWALYRSMREWDAMILANEGMVLAYGTYDENPQRIYTRVYMKYPSQSVPLILEQRVRRSDRITDFFPRVRMADGTLGPLPTLMEGINYNEEILAYMTPWRVTQQTSKAIHDRMKNRYSRMTSYRVIDGTGGAGGNVIAFTQNRAISHITAYERVPSFYNFMVNNVGLYVQGAPRTRSGVTTYKNGNQFINLHQSEFTPLTSDMRGTVLFLDVPWIHEGIGYRLEGYTYANMSLEDVVRTSFEKQALMVVLKLPPGYKLGLTSERVNMGKEDLLFVFPWMVRKREAPAVTGGNVSIEMVRHKVMLHIKDRFNTLFPNVGSDAFIRWIQSRDVPFQPSPFLRPTIEVPTIYAPLYIMATRMGIPRSEIPRPNDRDGIERLRQRIMDMGSQDADDTIERQLHDEVMDLNHRIDALSSIGNANVETQRQEQWTRFIVVPDRRLAGTMAQFPGPTLERVEFRLHQDVVAHLRSRYMGRSFDTDVAAMIIRYMITSETTDIKRDPPMPESFYTMMGATIDGYTNPVYAVLPTYYSPHPDTDRVFGSSGPFVNTSGSIIMVLPFMDSQMESRIMALLDRGGPTSIILVTDHQMANNPYVRRITRVNGRTTYILQTNEGMEAYPIPSDI